MLRRVLVWLIGAATLAAAPNIAFTPATLSFKYQIGSALPASQSLQVKSDGANFAFATTITGPLPYSAKWLSVSADSATTPATLKIYVNPSGLPAGTYNGTITITAAGAANSPQSVAVAVGVGDAAPTLAAAPASLTFNYVSGQALPAAQNLVLSSSGGALSATVSISGSTWLKAAPTGDIVLVGLPGIISVTVDPTGLLPGAYSGTITFTSTTAANKKLTVAVNLNVSAGVPTATSVWPSGVIINSPQTIATVTGTNFFGTSTAAIGGTAAITSVISSTRMLVTIPATMLTTAGPLSITVTTPAPGGGTSAATVFTVYPPGPRVLAVANAASYNTAVVTPGEVITIYGLGIGPDTLTVFSPVAGAIATTLPAAAPSTQVVVDGTAALLYVSSTQVSAIVPYAVAPKSGSQVDLVVVYNSIASVAVKVLIADVDPGIFTLDASGVGQGAILNFNATTGDYTINSASNPAVKGSTVVIYVTGFGQTNPAGDETKLIAGAVVPTATVSLQIGGQPATVTAAVAPVGSIPGVLQINATVPATAATGKALSVLATVGAGGSQAGVTLAVK